jgi:hypothetical protein
VARVLAEMETLSVTLDKEGSLQYGSRVNVGGAVSQGIWNSETWHCEGLYEK